MGSKLAIRHAGATDAVETAELFSEALRSMAFFPKLHTDEEDRAFVARFIAGSETWLAVLAEKIAGLAVIEADWLMHLYVHPGLHNRRIGSALLEKVKLERPLGFQLWTFQANSGARRFYERHGCRTAELTDGSHNEEKLPDIRYVWMGERPHA